MLTQERVKELFEYRDDGELVWRVNKGTAKVGSLAGSYDGKGYLWAQIDNTRYSVHRLVFLWHHGYIPENDIDHIDRNSDNNRVENLREVSRACNLRNKNHLRSKVSGVVGVSEQKRDGKFTGKWRSYITVSKSRTHIHVGFSSDFTEAVAHRLAAEQCLGWEGCHSSTSAYLYMKEYLNETRREIS